MLFASRYADQNHHEFDIESLGTPCPRELAGPSYAMVNALSSLTHWWKILRSLATRFNVTVMLIEPLEHTLTGENTTLIVYRTIIPAGDSSIAKVAVMDLSSRDPAFEAVRTDNMTDVKALLETRHVLGPARLM
jgi:hypothetical protein